MAKTDGREDEVQACPDISALVDEFQMMPNGPVKGSSTVDSLGNAVKRNAARPRSVVILIAAQIVLGIFSFFGGFVHVFLGIGSIVNFNGSSMSGVSADDLGALLIIVGILFLAAGLITLRRSPSSWTFGWIIAAIGLLSGVASLVLQTVGAIPGLILSLFVIYLLTRSDVKNYLQKDKSRTQPSELNK